jgi:hypothetical protein
MSKTNALHVNGMPGLAISDVLANLALLDLPRRLSLLPSHEGVLEA